MEKYCIGLDYTIKEAIERIDASKNRVVLVLDKESRVIGVVSQGDIIRALCSGKNLYTRVDSIIRPDFIYMNDRNMEEAYRVFKKFKITLMPIIDDEFHIIDIINMDDIYTYMEGRCKN
ncbi:CBS domain-containing protein [Pseudobutyrivibrio xylanivorans]|uniref:CBS domain-containing protein n=1 Tax=Pseudobutyrivibrio xylanivorans TaxID=185007 RepID=A0A1G5S5Q5_PSEXY|nr:CBS domain-containing protein [Pseudobutyrivibrio xylanivorans]SCZ81210.1 CBS domain-containing protein [Pseudobutyrivibrio xylanivorans]